VWVQRHSFDSCSKLLLTGLQDMQSSDLALSTQPGNTDYGTAKMDGYEPSSRLARYACAACLLLLVVGLATLATLARRQFQIDSAVGADAVKGPERLATGPPSDSFHGAKLDSSIPVV
jgi:hypothetical protein